MRPPQYPFRTHQILAWVLERLEEDNIHTGEDYLIFGADAMVLGTLGKLPKSLSGLLCEAAEETPAQAEARALLREIVKNITLNKGDKESS